MNYISHNTLNRQLLFIRRTSQVSNTGDNGQFLICIDVRVLISDGEA